MGASVVLVAGLGAAIALVGACSRPEGDDTAAAPPPPSQIASPAAGASSEPTIGYPRALWRLRPAELNRVRLNVAHIVIAHEGSSTEGMSLWTPQAQRRRRLHKARQLVLSLAEELKTRPGSFENAARRHSDDLATAPWGGRLGTRRGSELPDEFLDALDRLRPGEVSRPLYTSWGFHLLKRLPSPPEHRVAGAHILIKYEGSRGWWRLDRPRSGRNREEAERFAGEVAQEARANLKNFAELVRRHSDGDDYVRGGDIGVWSTRAGGTFALGVSVLAALTPGSISNPVEDAEGFHVLLRTDEVDRERYGASEIVISFAGAPGWAAEQGSTPERSKEAARQLASEIAAHLSKDPSGFVQAQGQYCDLIACKYSMVSWTRGRGLSAVEEALRELDIGEVTPKPVETQLGYHVIRREPPSEKRRESLRFEVPRPAPRRLEEFIAMVPRERLAIGARQLCAEAANALGLAGPKGPRFHAICQQAAAELERSTPDRMEKVISASRLRVRKLLGPERYAAYEKFEAAWLLNMQLGAK